MKSIQEIKEAAKTKLVGYTEKEIECFVHGAMFMAGNLPQRRSEEWYQKREEEKAQAIERSEAVCEHFKQVTGLGAAIENMKNRKPVTEYVDNALGVVFKAMMDNPEYRAAMLDMMGAEDKSVSAEIINHVQMTCAAFNETHETQLSFTQLEENDGRWTLSWDEPLK